MEAIIERIEREHVEALNALQRRTDLRLSLEAGGAQSDAAKLAVLAAATERRRVRHARQAADEAIERERIETTYQAARAKVDRDAEERKAALIQDALASFDLRHPNKP